MEGQALPLTGRSQYRWLAAVTPVVGPQATGARAQAFGPS